MSYDRPTLMSYPRACLVLFGRICFLKWWMHPPPQTLEVVPPIHGLGVGEGDVTHTHLRSLQQTAPKPHQR